MALGPIDLPIFPTSGNARTPLLEYTGKLAGNLLATKLAPKWLDTGIARSPECRASYFGQSPRTQGIWATGTALSASSINPVSTYARRLGQQLTRKKHAAFNEARKEFFLLQGIAGKGTHNLHHWNAIPGGFRSIASIPGISSWSTRRSSKGAVSVNTSSCTG